MRSPAGERAFSLIEVIISSALVLLLATLFINAVLTGETGVAASGMHARASLVAEEGIEAVHNIRDSSFLNLVDGTYGLGQSGGTWALIGTSDTEGAFTRSITISTIDTQTKLVVSTVTWPEAAGRTGSVSLSSYITDFSQLVPQSKSLQVNVSGGHISANTKVVGIKIKNIGASPITLSSTTVAWSGGSAAHFTEVDINGSNPNWASTGAPYYPVGQQVSSSTVGMTPAVLMQPNSQSPINAIVFDNSMHNSIVTITFIMSDNSTYTATTPLMP